MTLPQLSQSAVSGGTPSELVNALLAEYGDTLLADINDVTAIVKQGPSWVYAAQKNPVDPFPVAVIREVRCTRWRLLDVLAWQRRRIARAAADPDNGQRTAQLATQASAAAGRAKGGA